MEDALIRLHDLHVPEILLAASVLLVLVDYYFPIDYPAFIGYVCFAAGAFFYLPLGPVGSALAAAGFLVLLLILHRLLFARFLTNAYPRDDGRRAGGAA